MKKLLWAGVVAICAVIVEPAIATECEEIKQDKIRLKCYDERGKVTSEQSRESLAAAQLLKEQQNAEFKRLAAIFVRDAQANLAIAALEWQNFMDRPSTKPVAEVLAINNKAQADIANMFATLMSTPGKSELISDKIKDYYSLWGLAFSSIRPTSSDSGRSFTIRMNNELNRMDALANRLKMDL